MSCWHGHGCGPWYHRGPGWYWSGWYGPAVDEWDRAEDVERPFRRRPRSLGLDDAALEARLVDLRDEIAALDSAIAERRRRAGSADPSETR